MPFRLTKITNDQFRNMMETYRGDFIQWHKHLTKYIRIDRETFLAEFQVVLFKAMLRFDVNKATAGDQRFQRYFMSSLRKMCNTLLRKESSPKRLASKRFRSFDLAKHDVPDWRFEQRVEEMWIEDVVDVYAPPEQREFLKMVMAGYSRGEVCECLGLEIDEYRSNFRKIRRNEDLLRAVSCK
jgi:DNA-directed RNA polymerase specialized sigma24 family protein